MARLARKPPVDRLQYERALWASGCWHVAGVDEVGRGPLAGPVVAAAVILPRAWMDNGIPDELVGMNDSKQLTEAQRENYYELLRHRPDVVWNLAQLEADVIDRINILRATHAAMNAALAGLPAPPQHVLIDGLAVASVTYPQTALVKGDARSYSIAAASIIAKVTRDRLMHDHHQTWPQYGFASHKGYSTEEHLQAIALHGPCPIHRLTFSPLKPQQIDLL